MLRVGEAACAPSPQPGKDLGCVWLLVDEHGRELVARCQPGFPDLGLPGGHLLQGPLDGVEPPSTPPSALPPHLLQPPPSSLERKEGP